VTKAGATNTSWFGQFMQRTFASRGHNVDATWAVFFIPAAVLLVWALLDWWLIKDTPEDAGFPHLDTHDASSGQMDVDFTMMQLLKKVFTSPLMLLVAVVELTSGVFRYGIMNWYIIFTGNHKTPVSQYFAEHWGVILCFFGIIGGFAGGLISDKLFQSRRGPPAALLCGFVLLMSIIMVVFLGSSQLLVGSAAVMIVTAGIGITSLMSGTAATDFGGRKATATCSGIVDAFAYLGSGLQSVCLGYMTGWNWYLWPIFFMPFAVGGGIMAVKIWKELPEATKKYIAEVEKKPEPVLTYD
jgi:OPA family glycerol-3-phosphate transporter-like MFS transporter